MTDPGAAGRVLIISFSYWPMLNARAFRWTALAEDWARRGTNVHVVCALTMGRPRHEVVNGVHVHRAGMVAVERMRAWLASEGARQSKTRNSAQETPRRDQRTRLSSSIQAINRRLWRNLYWPDTSCLWYFDALREASRVARQLEPHAVISVSPTFTAVAVGRSLLRGHGPAPRWIIDFGDPFSYAVEAPPNNFRLYGRLNTRYERACFAAASAISVTNELVREGYALRFPESAAKIVVIPPLLTMPSEPQTPVPPTDRRRLVFLGTLYPSIRRPDYLLKLFRALGARTDCVDVDLHFYGDSRECADCFRACQDLLGSRVFVHGPVSREDAARAMWAASALVNIGNSTAYQLPSKIVEYAMTGKPILNLASVVDDSSSRFLKSYPLQLTLQATREPSASDVECVARFLQSDGRVPDSVLHAWVDPYTLRRVSNAYLELVAPQVAAVAPSPQA